MKSRSTFSTLAIIQAVIFCSLLKKALQQIENQVLPNNFRDFSFSNENGLSEDSPKQSIYEYSEFLMAKEDELRELANRLTTDTI